ncbi:MAG TPA: hypothetical protein VLF71_00840 [Candidatus Saccharimonadales bacterium]|nr:hypothetical protein [Candidatus Saccharimonadales bacterium]
MTQRKKLRFAPALFVAAVVAVCAGNASLAHAATFNPHRVADDQVFDNSGTMTTEQVDAFLNTFPGSCISTNNGFSAPDPTGYSPSGGYTYGANVSAGTVIQHAAAAYDLNPQVLLATLQKEQSLVSGSAGCSTLRYVGAMGYGCPDSGTTHSYSGLNLYTWRGVTVTAVDGTCVNSSAKAGFSQQVIHATWLLKFGEERSEGNTGWAIIRGSWDNSDDLSSCYSGPMTTGTYKVCPSGSATFYDGWSTIDGTAVHMESGATAALYWYTPHLSGNSNFFNIFSGWFGVPYGNANDYSFVTSSGATHLSPGATGSVSITLKNTGYNTWYSDHNLPAGQKATRLATIGYQNSPFIAPDANSLGTQNQVLMTPDTVAPGQTATFTFDTSAPYRTFFAHTRFIPIIDGAFLKDVGMDVVLSSDPPAWNPTAASIANRDLLPNEHAQAHFSVQNTGNSTWYSDGNVPAGMQPTRLATMGYQNNPFADTSDPNWLGTRNQIKMNEASVAPGQTATFDAWFIAPISNTAINSSFHFDLISGGVFGGDWGCVFNFTVPKADLSYTGTAATNPPATMSPGQSATVSFTAKNTGNVVWNDETYNAGMFAARLGMTQPLYRASSFYGTSTPWLSAALIKMPDSTTVRPGQSVTFTFTWKAPSQTGTYRDPFQMVVSGVFLRDEGDAFTTTVQ